MKLSHVTLRKGGGHCKPPQQRSKACHFPLNDERGLVRDLRSLFFEPVALIRRIEDEHKAGKTEQRHEDRTNEAQQIRARRHSGSGACRAWHGTHRPFGEKLLRGWHMPRKGLFSKRLCAGAYGGI